MIRGGNHAFGAGRYLGSTLESFSPLASAPPRPTMRWTLLIDGSGSMAAQNAEGTDLLTDPTNPAAIQGVKLLPDMVRGGDRYLQPGERDFFAMLAAG